MRVMKLFSACATTMIGLAGAAYADDDTRDADFLEVLHNVGIGYASEDDVIASGKAVCSYIAGGHTPNETAQTIENENPKLSPKQVLQFMELARAVYCPPPPLGGGGGG